MKKICNHIMALAITIAFTSTGIYAQELEEIIGNMRSDYKLERKVFVSLIKDKE